MKDELKKKMVKRIEAAFISSRITSKPFDSIVSDLAETLYSLLAYKPERSPNMQGVDWVKRYDKLREEKNMADSINQLVKEVSAWQAGEQEDDNFSFAERYKDLVLNTPEEDAGEQEGQEVERLKGLIEKVFKEWNVEYPAGHEKGIRQDERWQQFKTDNNL